MTKKLIKLLSLMLVVAIVFIGCQPAAEEAKSDDFEKYGQEFKGKIAKSYEESEEWWPTIPKPPAGTPNVLIVLLDDVGFAHIGAYGGLIETPRIDQLAQGNQIKGRGEEPVPSHYRYRPHYYGSDRNSLSQRA